MWDGNLPCLKERLEDVDDYPYYTTPPYSEAEQGDVAVLYLFKRLLLTETAPSPHASTTFHVSRKDGRGTDVLGGWRKTKRDSYQHPRNHLHKRGKLVLF